jgi:hypothetical protein
MMGTTRQALGHSCCSAAPLGDCAPAHSRLQYILAQRRKAVLAELRPLFEAEGNAFIHANRMGDANGISQAIEDGLHARYLYHAQI